MNLDIPETISKSLYKAALYLYEIITGKRNLKEFEVDKLIKVMEAIGFDWAEPKGSEILFRLKINDEIIITKIHKIHGRAKRTALSRYLKSRGSPFNKVLINYGFDIKEILEKIIKNYKKEV